MNEITLRDVLDRASDAVDSPVLATGALNAARQRRTRRRGATAAVGAAVVVIAIVVGVQVIRPDDSIAPAPSPSPDGPRGGVVAPRDVRDPLTAPLDLPDDELLRLPADLTPTGQVLEGSGGSVIAAVQTADGAVSLVTFDGRWLDTDKLPEGTIFRQSLAVDGGAVALRTRGGFAVYSSYSDKLLRYDAPGAGATGLWLGSVGFTYDVPGPGSESREHERPFNVDAVAFPAGDDLSAIVYDGSELHEFVDGDYLRWANFQDRGARLDMSHLGHLRGPVAGYGGADVVAVVRSDLGSDAAVDADGVLVLDTTGHPTALLPVQGTPIEDVQLHLWVDETKLLVQVGSDLILWDTRSDERTHVSTIPAGATIAISDGDGSLVKR